MENLMDKMKQRIANTTLDEHVEPQSDAKEQAVDNAIESLDNEVSESNSDCQQIVENELSEVESKAQLRRERRLRKEEKQKQEMLAQQNAQNTEHNTPKQATEQPVVTEVKAENKPTEEIKEQIPEIKPESKTFIDFSGIKSTTQNEALKSLEENVPFKYNGLSWNPHKFNIGDVVYVPQDEQILKSTIFDPIHTEQRKMPKKLTIATVIITNKVCYTFKETSKIIAHEAFVCRTEEECAKLCEELN